MKWEIAMTAVLVTGLTLLADDSQFDASKKLAVETELERFTGTWEIISTQPKGVTKDAIRLVFHKDLTYAALDKDGKELWEGTFELDPSSQPKLWDHRSNESKQTGGDALGIYELEGDELKLACIVGTWDQKQWKGKPRTTKFQLPDADVVLKLRRLP